MQGLFIFTLHQWVDSSFWPAYPALQNPIHARQLPLSSSSRKNSLGVWVTDLS
jgi:hypothetical protein